MATARYDYVQNQNGRKWCSHEGVLWEDISHKTELGSGRYSAYHAAKCINFMPSSQHQLLSYFELAAGDLLWPEECWQDYLAPIITKGRQGEDVLQLASYGMVPKRHQPAGMRISTMNARAETVGELFNYRRAWQQQSLCLVPMQYFYEPCYESGRAERWQIGMADGSPFAVAGLWCAWPEPDGVISHAFTQITINADDHTLMKRMHKPGDEKRSLVIVPPDMYAHRLNCPSPGLFRCHVHPDPVRLVVSRGSHGPVHVQYRWLSHGLLLKMQPLWKCLDRSM